VLRDCFERAVATVVKELDDSAITGGKSCDRRPNAFGDAVVL
jgi:hypothetical protein